MNKTMLAAVLAAAAAAAMPSLGGAVEIKRRDVGDDWPTLKPSKGRAPDRLASVLGKAFAEPGTDYKGYFWKQDLAGPAWRLYRNPPAEGKVTYDAVNDRSIVESGWGYVKPTYHHGDIR